MAYLSFIATLAVTAAVALHLGLSLTAAASGAACAVFLLYFVKRQSRIRFGAANLKVRVECWREFCSSTTRAWHASRFGR